ncbi:signal peptidase I [Vibrio sp. JCM 18905]|nr:signal peptidase I [Vibrio sp. JCM 18905]
MANTFSLMLVIATLVTGVVWLLEKLVSRKASGKTGGDSSSDV